MDRKCSECRSDRFRDAYSNTQWSKGIGNSRCHFCVDGLYCQECNRVFQDSNEIKMHMLTHVPRNISCPICNEGRFRSGVNVVQHVEGGHCSGCQGETNVKTYVSSEPHDENDPNSYMCKRCDRNFAKNSQLLQHQYHKHDMDPVLIACFVH